VGKELTVLISGGLKCHISSSGSLHDAVRILTMQRRVAGCLMKDELRVAVEGSSHGVIELLSGYFLEQIRKIT
jgi:hypothetical protein